MAHIVAARARELAEENERAKEARESAVKTAKEKLKAAESAEKKAAAAEKNRALAEKRYAELLTQQNETEVKLAHRSQGRLGGRGAEMVRCRFCRCRKFRRAGSGSGSEYGF